MSTFILLHGSWHGAWNWHKVTPLLERAGHKAMALDLPGHGRDWTPASEVTLASCVDKLCAVLDALAEPAVLVAHSRNGIVISQAAEYLPDKIKTLVYLAAYLVPNGQSMIDLARTDSESLVLPNLTFNREQHSHELREEVFREALYADCSDEIVALARTLLTPEPDAPGATRLQLSEENFGKVARVYIECLQDRAVTPSLQKRMYSALPCKQVISMNTSHSPFFSVPDELTAHLMAL
ncbi:MAG: alpha/beta fold hydrolase [Acidobacteria bacterium]|nr:alpha/beta fold hydrolase [Acidobacteriota bacterium]